MQKYTMDEFICYANPKKARQMFVPYAQNEVRYEEGRSKECTVHVKSNFNKPASSNKYFCMQKFFLN